MKNLFEALIKFCLCLAVIYLKSASAMETKPWSLNALLNDDFGPESTESAEDHNAIIHPTPVSLYSPKINAAPINNKATESSSEDDYEKRNYKYERDMTSNVEATERELEEMKKTDFSKYVRNHLKGKNIQIDNLSYEQKINNLNTIIEGIIKNNEFELKEMIDPLKLKKITFDQNKPQNINSNNNKTNNADNLSKSFKTDLFNLGQILANYHPDLVEIGLGYYSHKFFKLYYNRCKPEKEDSLDKWVSKNKIFTTSIRCFLIQYDSHELGRYEAKVQNKSVGTLTEYFQDSCDHLVNLYKNRNGVTMTLQQSGLRESQTRKTLEEFTNDYLLDFNFIKKSKNKEKNFSNIKNDAFRQIEAIDAEIAKKGAFKMVLGESATTAANIGSVLITQGTTYATQGINQGLTSIYDYYYNSTAQTQEPANTTLNTNANKGIEPAKKGWFGW